MDADAVDNKARDEAVLEAGEGEAHVVISAVVDVDVVAETASAVALVEEASVADVVIRHSSKTKLHMPLLFSAHS